MKRQKIALRVQVNNSLCSLMLQDALNPKVIMLFTFMNTYSILKQNKAKTFSWSKENLSILFCQWLELEYSVYSGELCWVLFKHLHALLYHCRVIIDYKWEKKKLLLAYEQIAELQLYTTTRDATSLALFWNMNIHSPLCMTCFVLQLI